MSGKCLSELHIGDDHGDNHATSHCELGSGHGEKHRKAWNKSDGKQVVVEWEGDDRSLLICPHCIEDVPGDVDDPFVYTLLEYKCSGCRRMLAIEYPDPESGAPGPYGPSIKFWCFRRPCDCPMIEDRSQGG